MQITGCGRECAGDRRTRRDDRPVARFLRAQRHRVYRLGCRTPLAAHAASTSGPGAIALLTFATPLWLSGLLLLPVIRWLHRGGRQQRAVLCVPSGPVAARGGEQARRGRAPAARPGMATSCTADRASLHRAVRTAAAGAEHTHHALGRRFAQHADARSERHAPRRRIGASSARCWPNFPQAVVEVRTLSDPWHSLGVLDDATVATLVAGAGRKPPNAPPAALLRRERLQWLLTDGADAALLDWPGDRRPDRVIQVAGVTRNVGLERLSARRNLNDPEPTTCCSRLRMAAPPMKTVRSSSPRTRAKSARTGASVSTREHRSS